MRHGKTPVQHPPRARRSGILAQRRPVPGPTVEAMNHQRNQRQRAKGPRPAARAGRGEQKNGARLAVAYQSMAVGPG